MTVNNTVHRVAHHGEAQMAERIVAMIAAASAIAIAFYSYRAMPERVGFVGFCAICTSYNAARTIWPMRVRERILEPKDPAKRAAHADAVARFTLFIAGAALVLGASIIAFFATRSAPKPWISAAIVPAAIELVALTIALSWRVYARGIRATIQSPHTSNPGSV